MIYFLAAIIFGITTGLVFRDTMLGLIVAFSALLVAGSLLGG